MPEGDAATLGRLALDLGAHVVIETAAAPIHATLFWRDGMINAEVSRANAFDVWSDTIEFKPGARTGKAEGAFAPGDRVKDYADLPVARDTVVGSVSELVNGGLTLKFEHTHLLVNAAAGVILPEPTENAGEA